MVSYFQELDREFRVKVLYTIRWATTVYEKNKDHKWRDFLISQGELSARLKKKIDTHDYSEEDATHERLEAIYKKIKTNK